MHDCIQIIAHIRNDFTSKFGIPRQSGIVKSLQSRIVFEPEFRDSNAIRGLEQFSHLWLIWKFSETANRQWSPTVRPPRLGGNTKIGVFATRSPFRPNPIGLSAVKLERIENDAVNGNILIVSGADIMDRTPIYDIKPYIAYTDCIPEANSAFATESTDSTLDVEFKTNTDNLSNEEIATLTEILANDPRPRYQNDSERVYGLTLGKHNIKFLVEGNKATVVEITSLR